MYIRVRNAEYVKEKLFNVSDKLTREKLARVLNGEKVHFDSEEINDIYSAFTSNVHVRYFIFYKDECKLIKVGFGGWDNEEIFNLKKYVENRMFSKNREKDNFRNNVVASKIKDLDRDSYSVIDFMEVM